MLRIWLFPSICFVLFLYGMIFLIIYSYDENLGYDAPAKKEVIDGNAIKRELKKI
ncbi:MAG: hypothetical protein E7K04_03280 [Helicobacter sp.]|nr:hypothetical protein [Helicobacter sp.]